MKLNRYILLTVAVSGAIVFGGCKGKKSNRTLEERTTRVTVQELQKRLFRNRIPVQGTITPVEYAMLSAKISGTLELLKVSEGDRRKTGDVLFGIDRQVLKNQVVVKEDEIKVKEAALQSANFALAMAKISRDQAKLDYDRALTLPIPGQSVRPTLKALKPPSKKRKWRSATPRPPSSTPKPSSSNPGAIWLLPKRIWMIP